MLSSIWKSITGAIQGKNDKSNKDVSAQHLVAKSPVAVASEAGDRDSVPATPKRLALAVKDQSSQVKSQSPGALSVNTIPLKDEHIQIDGCRRLTFGKDSAKANRTIMVLGATGAGKSTLINGMINYILGVEWDDSFRFKLVVEAPSSQAHSQTSQVTAYKINHRPGFTIDHSLTIIDTPGFGDTRGIQRDREIVEQLRNLFTSPDGVSEIDVVCFVVQAALARLTPSQKYVFDSVLSVFGKDVAENIRVLVTFADGQLPPVLEAINESGVPCPKTKNGQPRHFKFNNSALFASNKSSAAGSQEEEDEDGGFDKMFWNMGTKSMKRFFDALREIQTKSLTLTKEVLRERKQLENLVENLQKQVRVGLSKLEEIKETAEKLKEHEAEISRNENFEFEVQVTKPCQVDISQSGCYLTNCQQCHHTCHHPCGIPNDADKHGCVAMGRDGYCRVCPGKCIWSVHYNQKYKWDYQEVTEKVTKKELQEKYLKATGAKTTVQGLINALTDEYDALQKKVVELMETSGTSLNRLKEIALKPNPLSTPDYIDMLIEGEKAEAKPGWKQRVQSLMAMREKAEFLDKVDKGETLLQNLQSDISSQSGPDEDKTEAASVTNMASNVTNNVSVNGLVSDASVDEAQVHDAPVHDASVDDAPDDDASVDDASDDDASVDDASDDDVSVDVASFDDAPVDDASDVDELDSIA